VNFEWGERKRRSNLEKHDLDFLDASAVFEEPHLVIPSPHQSEERFLAIGLLEGRYVTVVYTVRAKAIRVISFRRARHEERQKYQDLYSRGN
jgi:uncharacterized DUF497 family protein